MEKNKFFIHRFLPILSVFLLVLFVFSSFSFGFTDEENAEINRLVTTMINNSKNNGVTWAIDYSNGSNPGFFDCNFEYNNQICRYVCFRFWNTQYTAVFDNNTIVFTNTYGGTRELSVFYYDKDLNLIGAEKNECEYKGSYTFNNINYYFKSAFSVKNSSGNIVEPFFQLAPPVEIPEITLTLAEIMEKEQAELKTIQEILGILPLILVVVVSFLGLRKALSWLLTLLRRS